MDSLSKRLDTVYKFIKEEYVLKNGDINCSAQDLYTEFKLTYSSKMSKEDFHRKLAEIGFTKTKENGKLWYNIPHKLLMKIAKSKYWLHELDEFEEIDELIEEVKEHKPITIKKTPSGNKNSKTNIDFDIV